MGTLSLYVPLSEQTQPNGARIQPPFSVYRNATISKVTRDLRCNRAELLF